MKDQFCHSSCSQHVEPSYSENYDFRVHIAWSWLEEGRERWKRMVENEGFSNSRANHTLKVQQGPCYMPSFYDKQIKKNLTFFLS